ncbi:MAG: hypothetical protein R2748_04485 [Bryobacterales bacterium]
MPHNFVEVRVYGENGGWSWTGYPPPPIPYEWNFWTESVPPVWMHVSAPIRQDMWRRFAGDGGWQATMSKPKRIEIRSTFVVNGGMSGLDNVQILNRGDRPAVDVLPTVTTFSAGFDNWTRNYPADLSIPGASVGDTRSELRWAEDEGNPGGRLVMAEEPENGGPRDDAFVAPQEYLGIYSNLQDARFEFDMRHWSGVWCDQAGPHLDHGRRFGLPLGRRSAGWAVGPSIRASGRFGLDARVRRRPI